MLTRAAAAKLRAIQENAGMKRTKTPLAIENFVDVFSLLSRWQLDLVEISCRQFRHVVSTMMDTVCLRELESVYLDQKTEHPTNPFGPLHVNADWRFTANGKEQGLSKSFSGMEEAVDDLTKRIISSAVRCIEFRDVNFTDEMILKVNKATVNVNVDILTSDNCDFSSTNQGAIRALISSFSSLRELSLNRCKVLPPQFTNDLLFDCARRPELRRVYFDVRIPLDYSKDVYGEMRTERFDLLDAGILALLFREVGEGGALTFGRAWTLGAIISDEFSKRLLEMASQHTAANNLRLNVACDIEQQMSHLADFQQFRRTVAASEDHSATTTYELPAKGRGKLSLTFSEAIKFSPRMLRFESGDFEDQ